MDYYAHSFGDGGDRSKWQPLAEHLLAVAKLAEQFAREALPGDEDFAHAARLAGLLHDLGKYRPEFQAMLAGAAKTKATRHKQAGAARAAGANRPDLAYAIAGHHGGLPDRGALKDGINGPGGNDVARKGRGTAWSDCPASGCGPIPSYTPRTCLRSIGFAEAERVERFARGARPRDDESEN